MKPLRWSLKNFLLLTALVGVSLAYVDQWTSERFLILLWFTTFVISSVKFSSRGWSKVLSVGTTTGAVWTAGIFATHLMYWNVPGPSGLALHAFYISTWGVAAAIVVACAAKGFGITIRCWLDATPRARTFSLVTLMSLSLVIVGWPMWSADRFDPWQPPPSSNRLPPDVPANLQHLTESNALNSSRISVSSDARWVAAIQSGNVVVYEATTGTVKARFPGARNDWYSSLSFLDDDRLMAVRGAGGSNVRMAQWTPPEWTAPSSIPLTQWVDASHRGQPILIDGTLLLVSHDQQRSHVIVDAVNPLNADGSLERRVSTRLPTDDVTAGEISSNWSLVPASQGLINVGSVGLWLFRIDGGPPAYVAGQLHGFVADAGQILVGRRTHGLVWKKAPRSANVEPPFWNHLCSAQFSQTCLVDIQTGALLEQTPWRRSEDR